MIAYFSLCFITFLVIAVAAMLVAASERKPMSRSDVRFYGTVLVWFLSLAIWSAVLIERSLR